ncbi:alpha-2,8-polysialyltransferase family protein [Microbacterium luteolum]|uniref:Alpha-2,8-polysialyltransferase family protein n=1 Tax=Microbacterium luteolum TaxID=69367 RepID=A0ABY7XJP7_MICLT|nr:polysialyltransferase family glycosyltransferase [Microbacterium luteolum]WDM42310.1 alpha-2,8-polysialyltransferase family protein [Microbacterium luteolum]
MTQLFALHSAYGLATAAAAIDAGLLDTGARGDRLLVPFVSARVPETTVGIAADPALRALRARFDWIEELEAILGPLHPSSWEPADADLPILERLLTRAWDLDLGDLELFVQSPQVAPARTLMSLFPQARITIIGDGLMTYSPMRVSLPHTVAARIGRVVHADVVPGVRPLVGSPHAEIIPVPPERFAAALRETDVGDTDALFDEELPTVLVLGQYLSALGLMSPAEEIALQEEMIDRAARWSPRRIVFKPHPSAPPLHTDAVRARAAAQGIAFVEYTGALAAELLAERLDAVAVVAGFSTALPTSQALFGRAIGAAGTETVLLFLTPYENSNRIPATIVDALTRDGSPYEDPDRLQLLVDAVGYAMQPEIAGHLRERAEELLTGLEPVERDRYFTPERLSALRLPGAPAESAVQRMLRPAGGVGRVEEWRLTALGARRRAGRAWRAIRGR